MPGAGFLLFSQGYGFADKACSDLLKHSLHCVSQQRSHRQSLSLFNDILHIFFQMGMGRGVVKSLLVLRRCFRSCRKPWPEDIWKLNPRGSQNSSVSLFSAPEPESFDRGLALLPQSHPVVLRSTDFSAGSSVRTPPPVPPCAHLGFFSAVVQTADTPLAAVQDGVSPCTLRLRVSQCTGASLGFSKNFANMCGSDSTGSSPAKQSGIC